MTTLWTRNANGTDTTTHIADAPKPQPAVPARVEVVDRTDPQAVADWRAGISTREDFAAEAEATLDAMLAERDPEIVCAECGWTYTGTWCEICTPCDDCGRVPAACACTSDSVDPIDL